jgi:ABC-type siderophore export system fused ATPase/permease subunit
LGGPIKLKLALSKRGLLILPHVVSELRNVVLEAVLEGDAQRVESVQFEVVFDDLVHDFFVRGVLVFTFSVLLHPSCRVVGDLVLVGLVKYCFVLLGVLLLVGVPNVVVLGVDLALKLIRPLVELVRSHKLSGLVLLTQSNVH